MTYKYMKLVDWINEQINNGNLTAGQKLPTEAELTRQFQVSRHSVRQAIAHMEQKGLVHSIQGSGTYISEQVEPASKGPAQGEEASRSNVIGLVMSSSTDYIFPDIIQGASDYLLSRGYLLNVTFTRGEYLREKDVLEKLRETNLAGLILEPLTYGMALTNDDLYRELAESMPMIMIHTGTSQICPALSLCDTEGTSLLVEHLIEKGHRKIGCIYAFDEPAGLSRYTGYLNTLHDNDIEYRDETALWFKRSHFDDFFAEEGNRSLDRMLQEVTAVVCHDDRVAYELCIYLRERGLRVPEDISVVGYDDSIYATLDEQITSVVHPKKRYGKRAAQAILELIANPEGFDISRYIVEPKLKIRSSVKDLTGQETE